MNKRTYDDLRALIDAARTARDLRAITQPLEDDPAPDARTKALLRRARNHARLLRRGALPPPLPAEEEPPLQQRDQSGRSRFVWEPGDLEITPGPARRPEK